MSDQQQKLHFFLARGALLASCSQFVQGTVGIRAEQISASNVYRIFQIACATGPDGPQESWAVEKARLRPNVKESRDVRRSSGSRAVRKGKPSNGVEEE